MHQSSCHLSHSLRSGPTVNRTQVAANLHSESGFLVRRSRNDASWATFSSWSSGILVTPTTPEPSMSPVSFLHYFTPLACIVSQPAVWLCRSLHAKPGRKAGPYPALDTTEFKRQGLARNELFISSQASQFMFDCTELFWMQINTDCNLRQLSKFSFNN